jgi:hypothetical protein
MMKKSVFLFLSLLSLIYSQAQDLPAIALIPEPVSVKRSAGEYTLPQNIVIEAAGNPEIQYAARHLQQRLTQPTGRT